MEPYTISHLMRKPSASNNIRTEEDRRKALRYEAEEEKSFEAWLKAAGYDANRPRERLQPWAARPIPVTLANGTRTTLSAQEAAYSSCFKGRRETFIVVPHPDKREIFWIGQHELWFGFTREIPAPLYFWEIGDDMFEVHVRRGYVKLKAWKYVKIPVATKPKDVLWDEVMREYFHLHSVRPTWCVTPSEKDVFFDRSFVEKENRQIEVQLSKEEEVRLRIESSPLGDWFSLYENVTSITMDGDLWKVDFERDINSGGYDGVAGSVWLNLKKRDAVKWDAWVAHPELAEKHRLEVLNHVKIKRESRETKVGIETKTDAEKKAETVDNAKAKK